MSKNQQPEVVVTRRIPQNGLDILRRECKVQVWPERTPPGRDQLRDMVSSADGVIALLTDEFDGPLMDKAQQLKVISNYAVGYDNIDVAAATDRGIAVTNTPGVLTETTADMTMALLLAAARRVVEGDRAVRCGDWLSWEPTYMLGRDLHHSRVGIIGMGRIGQAVARRVLGFSAEVVYTDTEPLEEIQRQMPVEYLSLEELLDSCDFVCIHVPLTEDTRHLLAAEQLQQMKKGSVLVNTSRGGVIEETALVQALREGPLAAAGLDVFDEEPLPTSHPLVRLDNVVLAPHLGSATVRTREAMARLAAENAAAVLRADQPRHIVNPEVLR